MSNSLCYQDPTLCCAYFLGVALPEIFLYSVGLISPLDVAGIHLHELM